MFIFDLVELNYICELTHMGDCFAGNCKYGKGCWVIDAMATVIYAEGEI